MGTIYFFLYHILLCRYWHDGASVGFGVRSNNNNNDSNNNDNS